MKQADDDLTIDLYAAPRSAQQPDHFADVSNMVDTNPDADIEEIVRPFRSVSELEAAKETLPAIPENPNVRLAHISENMLSLAVDLGIDASVSTSDMAMEAAHDMVSSATLLIRSGVRLIIAKEKCQHGEFEDHCNRVGIDRFRASEAMRYAQFASTLEPKERDKYLMLPKKSALLLANAEPALVEFLLEDGNEDLAKRLRKKSQLKELALELADTEHALEKSEKEVDSLYKEVKRLKEAHETAAAGSEYPADVVKLRKESSVLADEAIAALSSIQFHAEKFHHSLSISDPSAGRRNLYAAMYPAIASVASVINSASRLFTDLCGQYDLDPADIAGRVSIPMTQAELDVIDAARDMMLKRKMARSESRMGAYLEEGQLTRGRGRPRKGE
ncbi:hypothetical protein [Thiothrix nivea]|uniref:DUF3102 domain-containing protein n=1 Tax=Thiothrix nivea (strain ATCC 35100 / DSM 5205 / JP2) TaxID=870187 RepID=A0A656HD08_THINJ|nr:hypothetical protein [Thiothrix nivea]EIJ33336.1 hypothetical protein Thini_0699 [Thiothrix nivea DSM 5205]